MQNFWIIGIQINKRCTVYIGMDIAWLDHGCIYRNEHGWTGLLNWTDLTFDLGCNQYTDIGMTIQYNASPNDKTPVSPIEEFVLWSGTVVTHCLVMAT